MNLCLSFVINALGYVEKERERFSSENKVKEINFNLRNDFECVEYKFDNRHLTESCK